MHMALVPTTEFRNSPIEFTRQIVMAPLGSKFKKLKVAKSKVKYKLNSIRNKFGKWRNS